MLVVYTWYRIKKRISYSWIPIIWHTYQYIILWLKVNMLTTNDPDEVYGNYHKFMINYCDVDVYTHICRETSMGISIHPGYYLYMISDHMTEHGT